MNHSSSLILILFLSALCVEGQARTKKNTLLSEAQQALAEKMTTAPRPDEICFSPDQLCDVKLIKFA